MKRVAASLLLVSFTLTYGCASIAHGTRQEIPVTSSPTGAAVSLQCGKRASVAGATTPTTVLVSRRTEPCTIIVSKDGYEDASVMLTKSLSGWFWGNILIGGVIGMVIDAADGAMFKRAPEAASLTLAMQPPR
jgi:hypothetical protein